MWLNDNPLCLSVISVPLWFVIPGNINHRDTEITQRHRDDSYTKTLPKRNIC